MSIRLATAKDLGTVHAIYADPQIAAWLGRESMSLHDFQPLFDDLCARPSFQVWELDGVVVGFHHVSLLVSATSISAYLSTIALVPGHQGKGLARQVLGELIGELNRGGVARIDLIVDSRNRRAVTCYQRLGFVIERTLSRCALHAGQMREVSDHYMGLSLRQSK
ncbi:MAG: N-acetyltransferase family protein [Lysobacterales bacterium]